MTADSSSARPGTRAWRARVITVSDRAAAGQYPDRSGPAGAESLAELGFQVDPVVVVPDGEPVAAAIRAAVAAGVDLIVTCGGTGVAPRDRTPEWTRTVIDREVPGIAEAVRNAALPAVPTAMLSRGVAGTAGRSLVVNLPGSVGGVRDGMSVLGPIAGHALDQLSGGDHGSS